MLARCACAVLATLAIVVGCGGSGKTTTGSGSGGSGGGGGAACAADQFADPEGACHDVGLRGCADVFVDGDGVCRPSMDKCENGTIPKFDMGCVPVGIESCAPEFLEDDGLCHPSMAKCASGTFAVPRKGCLPIDGPDGCGSGTWGHIADEPGTLYVDPADVQTGADGSRAKPFHTLGEALLAATSGGRVALAAGQYHEAVAIGGPLEIVGRCASRVVIDGDDGDPTTPKVIAVTAGPVKISGLQIGGEGVGVHASAGAAVTLERVVLEGAPGAAVVATDGAKVTLSETLVEATRSGGATPSFAISADQGATLVLADSALADNHSTAAVTADGTGTRLTMTDTLVEATHAQDLFVDGDGLDVSGGATADLEDVAFVDDDFNAIYATSSGTRVTATRVMVAGNARPNGSGTYAAGFVEDASLTFTASAVVGVHDAFQVNSGTFKLERGLVIGGELPVYGGDVEIDDTALVRSPFAGFNVVASSPTTLRASGLLIERPNDTTGLYGVGLIGSGPAELDLVGVFVSDAHVTGILVTYGATAKISASHVAGVAEGLFIDDKTNLKKAADGIASSKDATVTLSGVRVEGCDRAGLLLGASGGSITGSQSTKNAYGLVLEGPPSPSVEDASCSFAGNSKQDVDDQGFFDVATVPPPPPD